MAVAMRGLRLRPTYEQLIGVAVSDELRNIKFPNRDAKFLRDGFVLSQLDGEGMRAMEHQQEMAAKEAFKESLLKQIASNTGANMNDLRSESSSQTRRDRINRAVYYNIDVDPPPEEEISSMSVQGEGLDQIYSQDENMPSVSSLTTSSESRSRLVADYEGRIQQLQAEHEEELRMNELQALKNIDMLQKRVKQELENAEYEKEMEEKKRLTLAAIKDGETIEFNRMSDDKNFRTKGTKNKKPEEDDPNPPRAKSRGPTTPSLPASSSGLGRGPAVVVQAKTKTKSRSRSPHDYPESTHEPKGPRGRPAAMQPAVKRAVETNPTKDLHTDEDYWKKQTVSYLKQQLKLRGFTKDRNEDKSRMVKKDYIRELMKKL